MLAISQDMDGRQKVTDFFAERSFRAARALSRRRDGAHDRARHRHAADHDPLRCRGPRGLADDRHGRLGRRARATARLLREAAERAAAAFVHLEAVPDRRRRLRDRRRCIGVRLQAQHAAPSIAASAEPPISAMPSEVARLQPLAEEQRAEQDRGDRDQEGDEQRIGRAGRGEQAEIEDVGEAGAEQRQRGERDPGLGATAPPRARAARTAAPAAASRSPRR